MDAGAGSSPSRDARMPTFHSNSGLQHISSNRYSATAESKGKRETKRNFSVVEDLGGFVLFGGRKKQSLRKGWVGRAGGGTTNSPLPGHAAG